MPASLATLEKIYKPTSGQLIDVKDEMMHLTRRLIKEYGEDDVKAIMLKDYALMNTYQLLLDMIEIAKKEVAQSIEGPHRSPSFSDPKCTYHKSYNLIYHLGVSG
ncbi:hypothetical protein GH714_040063 [Hevea brasiliensis]|uniref:Uncharacterized protein n=1 Tax=Hevea brasiliensis TaxID=3981 RepID=A0A6A6MSM5_HEVBR|nr:hypothetical protein GH714_040063 [Hevea brasiliensis]